MIANHILHRFPTKLILILLFIKDNSCWCHRYRYRQQYQDCQYRFLNDSYRMLRAVEVLERAVVQIQMNERD